MKRKLVVVAVVVVAVLAGLYATNKTQKSKLTPKEMKDSVYAG